MTPARLVLVGATAFISEYLDSGLGMGYGTAMAPILLFLGYSPLQVVPAILVSQLATDVAACAFHHRLRNVDLGPGSTDRKVALCLGLLSSVGVLLSVAVALSVPKRVLTLYIGTLVLAMGLLILLTERRRFRFSWGRVLALSFVASFNKGISGGGYGPLVMGGQIFSGVNVKNAVGITALAEALTCLVGFLAYLFSGKAVDWALIGLLTLCAVPAVPLAAATVQRLDVDRMRRYLGALIAALGALALARLASP